MITNNFVKTIHDFKTTITLDFFMLDVRFQPFNDVLTTILVQN